MPKEPGQIFYVHFYFPEKKTVFFVVVLVSLLYVKLRLCIV